MAGIGFKLQKILVDEIYLSAFKGFFFALVITSGPWLIMVLSLAILSIYSSFILEAEDKLLFNILLVHISVLTIIVTGTFQLFFTRIFSDKMYTKEREELSNIIATNLILTTVILVLLVSPFLIIEKTFPENIAYPVRMLSFYLVITFNIIWVLMNYISASDEFLGFVKHYIIGSSISVGLSGVLGYSSGLNGFIFGFYVGQGYIATILLYQNIKVFGIPNKLILSVIKKYPQYHILIVSGFFMYFGMWIDKFIYWYGSSGHQLTPILHYHADYNSIFFVAFLFMTPIMAIFFITMETSFYKIYYLYHEKYVYTETLERLKECCNEIRSTVINSLKYIVQVQGIVVVLSILFSQNILIFFKMPVDQQLLFSVILIGVFFHMLTLIICILLYYLDLKKETMLIYLTFLGLNGVLTMIFTKISNDITGWGYVITSIVTFVLSSYKLKISLESLNYIVFTKQKVPEQEEIKDIFIPATECYGRYYIKNGRRVLQK
jgi:uncharacterized membrane protein